MIETWFIEDIKESLDKTTSCFVVSDPNEQGKYLLDYLPEEWNRYEAHSDIEELKVKYEIEKNDRGKNVIIYTTIPVNELTFLMEYAVISGSIDLTQFYQYVKKKVHQHIGLNLDMSEEDILTAAKVSVGKGKQYWMGLSQDGMFDLESMLVPFLDDPEGYVQDMDSDVEKAFLEKIQHHIGRQSVDKPAQTVAEETVHYLFDGLANDEIDDTLLAVYHQWIDSKTYKKSFERYLDHYTLPENRNIWAVHPDHPFEEVDRQQLHEVISNLNDEPFIDNKLTAIKKRARNQYATLCGITWWDSVLQILQFDRSGIRTIASFEDVKTYYTGTFYQLDRAVRNLYTEFLSDEALMQPLQEKYNATVHELLEKWFKYFDEYEEEQTGRFKQIIEENTSPVAIIVGDGITYEIAEEVVSQVDHKLDVNKDCMLADLPSVTDNNMSRMYMSDGGWTGDKRQREDYLDKQFGNRKICFPDLEDINHSISEYDVALCSFKDIDDIGEKMGQGALKYLQGFKETLAEKIIELDHMGFQNIFLVSDHGFVLTGILQESDKIEFNPSGDHKKSERYIALKDQPDAPDHLFSIAKNYLDYKHLIFAKNLRSFKTKGAYGYAHGGASPQELVVPCFKFSSRKTIEKLKIDIHNKGELKEIEGVNFEIKLKTARGNQDLFSAERKCKIILYAEGREFASSAILTLTPRSTTTQEFTFDGHKKVQAIVIDAETKEHIDEATVTKSSARNLDGLL